MAKQIVVIGVGKIKEKYIADGIAEYKKRLESFASLTFIEIADESIPDGVSPAAAEKIMSKEASKILSQLKDTDYTVLLDLKGSMMTSEEFSDVLKTESLTGRRLVFIIGGSLGVHSTLISRADMRLCLSKMTFTHQMARFLITEQIYRGYTILSGGKYHR